MYGIGTKLESKTFLYSIHFFRLFLLVTLQKNGCDITLLYLLYTCEIINNKTIKIKKLVE